MTDLSAPDRLAAIVAKSAAVKQAHRDGEVDILNREHHASWDDVEWLLGMVRDLQADVAELEAEIDELEAELETLADEA